MYLPKEKDATEGQFLAVWIHRLFNIRCAYDKIPVFFRMGI